jgi:hypothetical protein
MKSILKSNHFGHVFVLKGYTIKLKFFCPENSKFQDFNQMKSLGFIVSKYALKTEDLVYSENLSPAHFLLICPLVTHSLLITH